MIIVCSYCALAVASTLMSVYCFKKGYLRGRDLAAALVAAIAVVLVQAAADSATPWIPALARWAVRAWFVTTSTLGARGGWIDA